MDLSSLGLGQYSRTSQVATTLGAHSERQVARSRSTMHGFACRTQTESLLGRLMGLHLGHGFSPESLPLMAILKWGSLTGVWQWNKGQMDMGQEAKEDKGQSSNGKSSGKRSLVENDGNPAPQAAVLKACHFDLSL